MKGIILAGGSGSRLYPLTKVISKQLLPVYDKPMIYYPLSVLMLADITDILLISTPDSISLFEKHLGSGKQFGIKLTYKIQEEPRGLADAFIVGEEFIGNDNVALVLGDNIFHGPHFSDLLVEAKNKVIAQKMATVFTATVDDPQRFGIIELDDNDNIVLIVEKPANPKSNQAVTGLYFYPNDVVEIAKKVTPSARGEIEITDINLVYLKQQRLDVTKLGRGFAWLDTGTTDSLIQAAGYVKTIEQNQGLKIACLEEIALQKGWITKEELKSITAELKASDYKSYLLKMNKVIFN